MANADCSTPTASAENLIPFFLNACTEVPKGSNWDTFLLISGFCGKMFHWMLSSVICSSYIFIWNILPFNFLRPKMARKHEKHTKSIKYTYGCHLAWSKGRASWELGNPRNLCCVFISRLNFKMDVFWKYSSSLPPPMQRKNRRTAWIAGRMQSSTNQQDNCITSAAPTSTVFRWFTKNMHQGVAPYNSYGLWSFASW